MWLCCGCHLTFLFLHVKHEILLLVELGHRLASNIHARVRINRLPDLALHGRSVQTLTFLVLLLQNPLARRHELRQTRRLLIPIEGVHVTCVRSKVAIISIS